MLGLLEGHLICGFIVAVLYLIWRKGQHIEVDVWDLSICLGIFLFGYFSTYIAVVIYIFDILFGKEK